MPTILVVDDERHLLRLYEKELKREGYHVCVAATGREALALFDRMSIDLAVLDIRLPDIDGIEIMERMLSKRRSLPIILNTGYSSYKDSYSSWCADAYVVKSSDLTELKSKIAQLLIKRRSSVA